MTIVLFILLEPSCILIIIQEIYSLYSRYNAYARDVIINNVAFFCLSMLKIHVPSFILITLSRMTVMAMHQNIMIIKIDS